MCIRDSLAGTLLSVTVWTFAFAILSVVLSFAVGLGLAIVYNDPRVKGRRFLRALFILPTRSPRSWPRCCSAACSTPSSA